jgi:hypothetical protein
MSETGIALPAPAIETPPPAGKWEREHRAFQRLLPELLKTHAGKHVAIHDEQAVDSDTDELVLIERVLQRASCSGQTIRSDGCRCCHCQRRFGRPATAGQAKPRPLPDRGKTARPR